MAGGTSTVVQWEHHWAHKPRSGPHWLAWVAEHRLFPLELKGGREKKSYLFSMSCTISEAICMASRCKLKTRIVYDFPRYEIVIILKREKPICIIILPQSGAGALHVPSLRQMAWRNPFSSNPGSQRKVMRAPEWWNRPSVDPWVGTGGLRQPTTDENYRHVGFIYIHTKFLFFRTKCPVIKITTHRRHL